MLNKSTIRKVESPTGLDKEISFQSNYIREENR